MLKNRRNHLPGATCFFTVNGLDRQSARPVTHTDILRATVRAVRGH